MSLYAVSPGISSSAGHDKLMALLVEALSPYVSLKEKQLMVKTSSVFDYFQKCYLAWMGVETVKKGLAELQAYSWWDPAAWMIRQMEGRSADARFNADLSDLLTEVYKQDLWTELSKDAHNTIVSTHYLALRGMPQNAQKILVGPDIWAQPAVGEIDGDFYVLSPCNLYSQGLKDVGVSEDRILDTGPIFSARHHRARTERLYRRTQGLIDKPKSLICVGGSAPERFQVEELVRVLVQRGHDICLLAGAGTRAACMLRQNVEKVNVPSGVSLEIYGGTPGFTRSEELRIYNNLLARPDLSTWITRPNEGSLIGVALGFETWLLEPYQTHERKSAEFLMSQGVQFAD